MRCRCLFLLAAGMVCKTLADGPGLGNLTYNAPELTNLIARFETTNGVPRGQGFVAMHKGWLFVPFASDGGGGNGSGGFAFFNVSNPRSPLLTFTTEGNTNYTSASSPNYGGDLREPHGYSFHSNIVCFTMNKIGGSGLQFWDFSNIDPPNPQPLKLSQIVLPGLTGGDYAPTPWWVFWQGGRYAYVAGTSGGLYIVDASNPAAPVLLSRPGGLPNPIPTSQSGGFAVNTVFAIGNLLVVSMSDGGGIALFDIGDPANPALVTTHTGAVGYSMMVNGGKILGANDPAVIFDISSLTDINVVATGPNVADKGGYGTFQDGWFHYGSSSKYVKLDMRSLPALSVTGTAAPTGFSNPDWDFATALGNLIFMGNDHSGSALTVHSTAPDTNGPIVNWVVPVNGATNQPVTSRVGLTFTDQIDLRSVNSATVIIRPQGGGPAVPGRYSHQTGIVNFWPDESLAAGTTYEVVVPVGGVRDYVSNTVPTAFSSTFTTQPAASIPLSCTATQPPPALVGQTVNFAASATGSGAPQFSWNFGDGSPVTSYSINSSATHSYAAPGRYPVTVMATNGISTAAYSFIQIIHRPITATQAVASSTILFDATLNRIWCVNPDAGTVAAVDAVNLTNLFERATGWEPRTIARAPDGTIWVVNEGDATVSVLSPVTGYPVQSPVILPRASRPFGLVFSPDGAAAYITLRGTGRLLKLNPASRAIVDDLALGPTPKHLALSGDSQRILVARFISPDTAGEVVEVNAGDWSVARTFALGLDPGPDTEASGRGVPNYLGALGISPDGASAWVPSKKDNLQRGLFRDGLPLTFESTVRTIVSQLDLVTNTELLSARIDLNDRDMAQAVAFSPVGDLLFIAVQGNNTVEVFDAYHGSRLTGMSDVGRAPQGLALSPDGARLFVQCFMSRSIRVFDVSGIVAATNAVAFPLGNISTVAAEPLPPQVFLGKQIFYNAEDQRMNHDSYLSCASCHLDGGSDGRTWDFTDRGEGLRNTITLLGRSGPGQGRVHWTANFDEIQDFEHDIRGPFDGDGFMSNAAFNAGTRNTPLGDRKAGFSPELDALAAYVGSLTNVPPSPYRNQDGSLTADGVAGKALFQSLGCAACHSGNQFTDSATGVLHDVGTLKPSSGQRLGQPLTGLDTPTLKGLWEAQPYLHDGSAPTVMDVLATANPTGMHGNTATLTPTQLNQLAAYLLQIDETEIVHSLPTVSLLWPPADAMLTGVSNVVVIAQAAARGAAVQRVEFYDGAILLGNATQPPFHVIWNSPSTGPHILGARVFDTAGDSAAAAAVNITITNATAFSAHINFQTAAAPVPAGYAPDVGSPYGPRANGLVFGWNANTPDTRYRQAANSPDLRYDTLIHLQKPANPNAIWEIAVSNGIYQLFAVSGDAGFFDGYFHLLAEGVTLLNGVPTTGSRWVEGSQQVTVTDGRLTISSGPQAMNNKFCFIDIASMSSAGHAPAIALTNPIPGSSFVFPSPVELATEASDVDGAIAAVDFFAGAIWLGRTTNAPHAFIWSGAPIGSHTTFAVATDNEGAQSASIPVTIQVTVPPQPPFHLSHSMSDGIFSLGFQTVPGRLYTVEHTATLSPPDWQPLTNFVGDGAWKTVTDTGLSGEMGFYRVRSQ